MTGFRTFRNQPLQIVTIILEKGNLFKYNMYMINEQKQFTAELTPEAEQQLSQLELKYKIRISEAIKTFELVGTYYKNLNDLGNGLYEIKPKDVRAYFMYDNNRRRIIIVGFITLKKTQKAPKLFMEQARRNIEKYQYLYNSEKQL